jgi:uncharacterized membrane protein (DUF2068 family)
MNQLSRSTGLKIAAAIVFAQALIGIIWFDLPFLAGGMTALDQAANAGGSPPFWLAFLSFAVDAITIVAAYGAWRAARWGIILVIVVSVFNAILNTYAVVFDPYLATRILEGVFVFASLSVIYLCLRREPELLAKSV